MKINQNQLPSYIAKGYSFNKRSKPTLVGGQTVQIETYNKSYGCFQKPKLLFFAIFKMFTNCDKAKQNWQALFLGKKIITVDVPVINHVPCSKELDELIADPEILAHVEQIRDLVRFESGDDLSEDDIKALEAMGQIDLNSLLDSLDGIYKDIIDDYIIKKIKQRTLGISYTPSNFKGSDFRVREGKEFKVKTNGEDSIAYEETDSAKATTTNDFKLISSFKLDVYVEEEKDSVYFDGFSYPLALGLLQKIFQGYAWKCLDDACVDDNKIETLIEDLEFKDLIKVKLKPY